MTTYSLTALKTRYDENDELDLFDTTSISIAIESDSSSISYSLLPAFPDELPHFEFTSDNVYSVIADGQSLDLGTTIARIFDLAWGSGNVTTILEVELPNDQGQVSIRLGGDVLPNFPTLASFADFNENSITGATTPTSGPFAAGADIDLSVLPGVSISEDDLILGSSGDDTLLGGAGSDQIIGFDGDDSINPGDNFDFDYVETGPGDDTVNFADAEFGFFDLGHWNLDAGITTDIDGTANTGSIDKGANGTTTLLNVQNAMQADGLYVGGTNSNDVFNLTIAQGGYTALEGWFGNDTYNVNSDNGFVRIDLSDGNNDQGAVADLGTGIISNDGFGTQDVINGSVTELRGTDFADSITGSDADYESFILRAGDDTLDGGDGNDRVRYDRSGVTAVTVDLEAGTATGSWSGTAFTHSLSNIEYVRGSRADNDTLLGDASDNILYGRGGDDSLVGRSGDDTLLGEDGNDTLRGGDGRDRLNGDAGNDLLDASGGTAETQGFGDYIRPGIGDDIIIGHAAHYADGDGIDLSYANISGIDGVTIVAGDDGTGTAVSGNGVSNDTFSYVDYFEGSQDSDSITGSNTTPWEGFAGMRGDDTIDGRGGIDRVDYSYEALYFDGNGSGITANLTTGIVTDTQGGTDTLLNIEQINGSDFADFITAAGKAEDVTIEGNDGDDTLHGGAGDDRIEDDSGSNILLGNDGNDDLAVHEGENTVDGGNGYDTAEIYDDSSAALVINYQDGASGDQLRAIGRTDHSTSATVHYSADLNNIERVATGYEGDLLILGDGDNNTIKLINSPQTIDFQGGGGTDTLELHQLRNDDGSIGLSRADFDAETGLDLGGATTTDDVRLFNKSDDETHGYLTDVEQIRFTDGTFTLDELAGVTSGPQTVNGTAGNDTITGSSDSEVINGLAGDDIIINNGGGRDTFNGGAGSDTLRTDVTGITPAFVLEFNTLTGVHGRLGSTQGQDVISGIENFEATGTWDALITGDVANNRFQTDQGNDTLLGGVGFDTLISGAGDDSVNGGNGRDRAELGLGNDTYTDTSQAGEFGRDTVFGGNGNDSLFTGNADDELHGQDGDDSMNGQNGNDLMYGGTGADTLIGEAGNDTIAGGNGRDLAVMGGGDDVFNDTAQGGLFGQDTVFAGDGNDTVYAAGSADEVHGQNGNDLLYSGIGNDTVYGGTGFDTIYAGDNDDLVLGGNGRDRVFLGKGADVFIDNTQSDEFGRDTVFGGNGDDTITGGGADDEFHGEFGNDVMFGGIGNDRLFGGVGFDTIDAGTGNDTVFGGNGRDQIILGDGADRYVDSAQGDSFGADTITGGAGADVFVFSAAPGADVITDYEQGTDALELTQSLWGGGLSEAQVVSQFASVVNGDVVFDFTSGQSLTLQGLTSTTGLEDDITLL